MGEIQYTFTVSLSFFAFKTLNCMYNLENRQKRKNPKNPLAFYYFLAYNTNCKQKKTFATAERKDNKVAKRTYLNYFHPISEGGAFLPGNENVYAMKGEI